MPEHKTPHPVPKDTVNIPETLKCELCGAVETDDSPIKWSQLHNCLTCFYCHFDRITERQ